MVWRVHNTPECIELSKIIEEGGPIIRCYPDGQIKLFEIPQYGGEEYDLGHYTTLHAAITAAESWA